MRQAHEETRKVDLSPTWEAGPRNERKEAAKMSPNAPKSATMSRANYHINSNLTLNSPDFSKWNCETVKQAAERKLLTASDGFTWSIARFFGWPASSSRTTNRVLRLRLAPGTRSKDIGRDGCSCASDAGDVASLSHPVFCPSRSDRFSQANLRKVRVAEF